MKRFTSLLTYADLGGRRRMRRYVLAALLLLGLTLLVFAWAQLTRLRARGVVWSSRPLPEQSGLVGSSILGPDAAPKPVDEAIPNGDKNVQVGEPPICPVDPDTWTFHLIFPSNIYHRIEPACVYTGLEEAAAWVLLTRLGYSKPEAAEALKLSDLPWKPSESVVGLSTYGKPIEIPLIQEWPAHPDYHNWIVDSDGNPALIASLQGCYPMRKLVGKVATNPITDYPVLCSVALDFSPGWSVHKLAGHCSSIDSTLGTGTRIFAIFGYQRTGVWVYLGERSDLALSFEDSDRMQADRSRSAVANGLPIWDAIWLQARFGLSLQPLPPDWQNQTDPAALEAIGDELTRFIDDK